MGINALLAALVLIPTAFVAMLPGEFGVMFLAASQRTYYLAHRYRVPVFAVAYVLFGLLCIRAAAGETSTVWLWVTGIGLAINSLMLLLAYPPNVFRPITEPQYMDAVHADRVLSPDDEVVGLTEGGPARAYALDTIIRPHAVVDRLGTVPLFVSWCSLSNTGIAFQGDSVLNLRPLTAINNNIAFYDPDTKNLIQQIEARVVCGPDCGKRLQTVPIWVSRWKVWRQLHPDTLVCRLPPTSRVDNMLRETMLWVHGELPRLTLPWHAVDYSAADPRLPPMARVLGIEKDRVARAYTLEVLSSRTVISDTIGTEQIVIFCNTDLDMAAVFSPRLNGQTLTFAPADGNGVAKDKETGTFWSVEGRGLSGPFAGATLHPLPHFYHKVFWFNWVWAWPDTELIQADTETRQPYPWTKGKGWRANMGALAIMAWRGVRGRRSVAAAPAQEEG